MGFRNPITTASAVDTGRGPSNAGVRLYQDTTFPAVPVGVAEWRTGQMNRNATAKLSGGGSGGSSFVIDGGSPIAGQDAPQVKLGVESLAAGGYGPVLRLIARASEGGQIIPDVPLQLDTKYTAIPLTTTGALTFTQFDANNTPRYAHLPDGTWLLEGIAQILAGTLAAGASAIAGTLPGGPAVNAWRPAQILTSAGAYYAAGQVAIDPSGHVLVYNTTGGALGPGASFVIACTFAPASSLTT